MGVPVSVIGIESVGERNQSDTLIPEHRRDREGG